MFKKLSLIVLADCLGLSFLFSMLVENHQSNASGVHQNKAKNQRDPSARSQFREKHGSFRTRWMVIDLNRLASGKLALNVFD